jgi:hypothetical protein
VVTSRAISPSSAQEVSSCWLTIMRLSLQPVT